MASESELLEVFRLAELAGEGEIVRVVGDRVANGWLSRSRVREADGLLQRSLGVQTSAQTLDRAAATRQRLGRPDQAIPLFERALALRREVGDRDGEAATLNNIGLVYDGLGDRQQALTFYNQALPLQREVGNRAGEAVTRYNIAMVHRALGQLDDAVRELEIVVELDRQVQHPDLETDTQMLQQCRRERDGT